MVCDTSMEYTNEEVFIEPCSRRCGDQFLGGGGGKERFPFLRC